MVWLKLVEQNMLYTYIHNLCILYICIVRSCKIITSQTTRRNEQSLKCPTLILFQLYLTVPFPGKFKQRFLTFEECRRHCHVIEIHQMHVAHGVIGTSFSKAIAIVWCAKICHHLLIIITAVR